VAFVVLAGCGSDPSPREALAPWARAADSDCRKAVDDMSSVEEPVTLRQLAKAAPLLASEWETATRTVERRPVPEGGASLAQPLVRQLRAVRVETGRIAAAAAEQEHVDIEGAREAMRSLAQILPQVESAANAAGTAACGDVEKLDRALDAVRTPLYLYAAGRVIGELDVSVEKAMAYVDANRTAIAADSFADAWDAVDEANTRLGELEPPGWVKSAHSDYVDALDELSNEVAGFWDTLDSRRLKSLPESEIRKDLRTGARSLISAGRREIRARTRLSRVISERLGKPSGNPDDGSSQA
jgi:hypothetical protein